MKKILILDNKFYNYGESIEHHLPKEYIVRRYQITMPINNYTRVYNFIIKKVQEIFGLRREFPFLRWQIGFVSEQILNVYHEFKPDFVIVIKGDYISRKTLQQMKKSKLIMWMMDSYERYSFLLKDLELYDNIFVFEKNDIKLLQNIDIKAEFLPLCADEEIYYPKNKEKDIDILFIGAMYAERKKMIEKLIKKFNNYNVNIYGYHINRFEIIKKVKYILFNQKRNYFDRVTPQEANELYARSKICLNMHNWQSKMGANPRTFEILATKSFQLVDYNSYIEHEIKDGIVMYNNEKDLFDKINYYIDNRYEREIIAEKGYRIVRENHCFDSRILKIVEKLK